MGVRYNRRNFVSTQYYQLPVALYTDAKYRDLTQNAKVAYAILLSQAQLSYKNGFFEDNGDIYIYYSWDKLGKVLNVSHGTVKNILKSLEEIGLIERTKQIFSNASKIYVKKLDEPETDEQISDDNLCPKEISDELVREIQQVNDIANMDINELEAAMADGSVLPFADKLLSTLGRSTKNVLSEYKKDADTRANAESTKSDTPKVQNLHSEAVQNLYSRCTKNDLPVQKTAGDSTKSDTQTNSISNSNYLTSKDRELERQKDRERGSTGAGAGVRARILEGNASESVAKDADEAYTARDGGQSASANFAPVDTVDNSITEEKGGAASQEDDFAEVYTLYRENIQDSAAPLVKKALRDIYDQYGKEITVEAITQGALSSTPQEKKGIYYISSIAKRITGGDNNFSSPATASNQDKSTPAVKTIQAKKTFSMDESRRNIHSMIDNLFSNNNSDGGMQNDRSNRTGTC